MQGLKRTIGGKRFYITKEALPMLGHLDARFKFTVFKGKRKKIYNGYNGEGIQGNDTASDVSHQKSKMFRNAFLDAKISLFNLIGGSYPFTSELTNYGFYYDFDEVKGRTGKIHTIEYYNEQIPYTERITEARVTRAQGKLKPTEKIVVHGKSANKKTKSMHHVNKKKNKKIAPKAKRR